jgi:two-component system, chemotaxis family, response regulator Rcp1
MNTGQAGGKNINVSLGRPIHILLVEDSPSDVAMTTAALREGRIANELHVVSDGAAAMSFVRHEGRYSEAPRPDLVILDLNLPKMDGREVLEQIKSDDDLKVIPVVVLTTSSSDEDIVRSYRLQANSYVTKPVGLEPFLAAVRGIEDFWLCLVKLPNEW